MFIVSDPAEAAAISVVTRQWSSQAGSAPSSACSPSSRRTPAAAFSLPAGSRVSGGAGARAVVVAAAAEEAVAAATKSLASVLSAKGGKYYPTRVVR